MVVVVAEEHSGKRSGYNSHHRHNSSSNSNSKPGGEAWTRIKVSSEPYMHTHTYIRTTHIYAISQASSQGSYMIPLLIMSTHIETPNAEPISYHPSSSHVE